MSLDIEQKMAVVSEVTEAISGAEAAILAEYRGLTVAQMTELRRKAREAGVFLRVVKNSLAKRAVEGSNFECLKDHMVGPLALAASTDPAAVAKVLDEFAKENDKLIIKTGAMGGVIMSQEQLKALARLPGREELLAILLATMNAPMQKFVRTLNEVPAAFVRTLVAIREAREAA
ncbi:MAG: 50S ribosomal protein L10 [Acidiferrobacterales bacterium]